MRADLVDDFDKLVLRVLTQMDAQPGDAATFGEAYAALRALRDAPVVTVIVTPEGLPLPWAVDESAGQAWADFVAANDVEVTSVRQAKSDGYTAQAFRLVADGDTTAGVDRG